MGHLQNRIYISGKVTGLEKHEYMERFCNAELFCESKGLFVINPARIFENARYYLSYAEIMKLSLELLDMCDSIYMLKGWESSKGARMEKEYAYTTGKCIFYEGGDASNEDRGT